MFLVLQEPDTGLGIVNKTSLKIYNDPFCFFSFLKACMSGLIDAGKLPENERLNQVLMFLGYCKGIILLFRILPVKKLLEPFVFSY